MHTDDQNKDRSKLTYRYMNNTQININIQQILKGVIFESNALTPKKLIKALRALVGRKLLSVCWENGPKRGLKTVSFNPLLSVM